MQDLFDEPKSAPKSPAPAGSARPDRSENDQPPSFAPRKRPRSVVWILVQSLAATVLVLFALLKLMDPDRSQDTLRAIAFFLVSVIAGLETMRERSWIWPAALMASIGAAWSLWLLPQALMFGGVALLRSGTTEAPGVALWRDTLTLALAAVWTCASAFMAWRRRETLWESY